MPRDEIPCVGAIVLDGAGRLLLVRRANPPAQGKWSIPGGRVEPSESDEQAAVRELLEETGLIGSVTREVGSVRLSAPSGGTYVVRDFLISVVGALEPTAGDDASDARWFTADEVRALDTSPGLLAALAEWGIVSPPS